MNTITQYLRRGTLDEQTAAVMKRLAKDKLERAILDVAYANGSYEKETEQVTLLKETKKKRWIWRGDVMKLIRANVNDCEKIWKMQTEAFSDL